MLTQLLSRPRMSTDRDFQRHRHSFMACVLIFGGMSRNHRLDGEVSFGRFEGELNDDRFCA